MLMCSVMFILLSLVNRVFFLVLVLVLSFFFLILKFSSLFFISLFFVMDKFSFILLVLTLWISILIFFCLFKYGFFSDKSKLFIYFLLMSLTVVLSLSFLFFDLLGFYIFFEISLLPLLFIILGWGYQIERVSASFYLFVYTLFGSFPLFVILIFLGILKETVSWGGLENFMIFFGGDQVFLSGILFLCFMVKLPAYLLHLWLPKAHVEAPVMGSMILAAVLLKLSAYACYRFFFILSFFFSSWLNSVLSMVLWGSLLASIICFTQSDIKSLIAYSSVSHMGVMIAGIFLQSSISMLGAWIIMLGHGFCSSGLFFLANFHYEQNLSRQLLLIRAQSSFYYYVLIFWVLFLFINFSMPPFLNLLGEINILVSLFFLNWGFILLVGSIMFFVAGYCVYAFSILIHGANGQMSTVFGESEMLFFLLVTHIFPLGMVVLKVESLWL